MATYAMLRAVRWACKLWETHRTPSNNAPGFRLGFARACLQSFDDRMFARTQHVTEVHWPREPSTSARIFCVFTRARACLGQE